MLQDLRPIAPPDKTKEDILLFFKLYDPEKKELRYSEPVHVLLHIFSFSFMLSDSISFMLQIRWQAFCEGYW